MSGYEQFQAAGAGEATLAALRQATATLHARIESSTGLGAPFGLAHYGHVVQAFHAFLRHWEPQIARALPQHLCAWFAHGRRLPLLERDLAALGLRPLQADLVALPPLETPAQALGSLYVLEGSALGGRVIAADVRRRLDLDAERGAAYFNGAGSATGARWREFRQHLAGELDDAPRSHPCAVRGAVDTFESLMALFQRVLHERAAA